MAIDFTGPAPAGPRPPQSPNEHGEPRPPAPPLSLRGDTVEISHEARALAERASTDRVPLTEARMAEIRERLETGYYSRPEVVGEIASRIVDSGDL